MTIVCSDCARNGKTLFAKLASDLLTLRLGQPPFIFDTDNPDGSLLSHFQSGESALGKIVDIGRIAEQVALFDSLLAAQAGGAQHFLIDLVARHRGQFFEIFKDIDFEQGAQEAGLSVSIFYMIDRTEASVMAAKQLASSLHYARFIPIRNGAIGDVLDDWHMAEIYQKTRHDREIFLPALSPEALGMVEHTDFHFDAFVAGRYEQFSEDMKSDLWGFLESLYAQRESTGDGTAHPI